MEDVASEYASSLHDLTTNSKPLISMLTMLAEEYRLHAPSIVKVIEDYLKRSCPKIKLPTLYLIDSIIKNVREPYNTLFTENIIKIFLDVFQEGDEKIRSALYKLRQTWKGLLPDVKLYMIDALTKKIDPNWPICPSLEHLASSIHLNPKFFGRQPPTIEITQRLESDSVRRDNITTVKDAVAPTEVKVTEQNKQRQNRIISDAQSIPLELETAENLRSSDSSVNRASDQRRTDPRLKRRHDQQQQLFEQQLLQADVVMAEKVKADGSSNKEISSGSKRAEKKSSSAKRSRSSEKEQQRANGKRSTGEDSSKDRSTSSKTTKEKLSSSSSIDRKSSRGGSSGSNKKSKSSRSSSEKNQLSIGGRSPSKSPVSLFSGSGGGGEASIALNNAPSFADKEAAAILTGDIDLRILEPINKKPKTEKNVSSEAPLALMDVFPKGDIDLRIRPTGGVSEPGQPLSTAVVSAVSSDCGELRTTSTANSECKTRMEEKDDDDEDDDDFDKESQWAKLKGRPLRNPVVEAIPDRGAKKENPTDDRLTATTKEYSSTSQINDPLGTLPLRGAVVRPAVPEMETVRSGSSLPQTGARLPLASLPIVDVTPKQNAIPDLFPPGRSRAHIKISDPAPDSGQIRLDGRMREVRFVDGVAIAVMDEAPPNFVRARQIMFKGGSSKKILINEHHQIMAAFDGREHEFTLNGNRHRIRFGAPLRELYVDGIPYSCQFNGVPVYIRSREDVFSVTLHPPCPSVNDKMEAPKELLAKLGLLPMPPEAPAIGPGGCVVGVIPPGGQVPIAPMAAPMGASHLVGGPSTGGWVRYQEDDRMTPAPYIGPPGPPGHHGPPGMYPPPGMAPHNMMPMHPPSGFAPGRPGPPGMFCPHPTAGMGGPIPGPPMGPSPYGPMGPPGMIPYGQPHHGMHGPPHMMTAAGGMIRQPITPSMGPPRPQEQPPGIVAPVNIASAGAAPQVNVSDLLNQLVTAGIIGGSTSTPAASATDPVEKKPTVSILHPTVVKEEIPKLSFKQTDQLKQRHGGVIAALHDGLQCATCGQRFKQADKNSDKYAQHLDWHFRMARREREGMKKASSRKWFYDINDWVQFEEVEDIEDRARSYFELQEAQHDAMNQEDRQTAVVQEVPAVSAKAIDQGDNTCELCREPFELFFCEETEEWRLKNAVLSDGRVFHPVCRDDFLRPAAKPAPELNEKANDEKKVDVKVEAEEELIENLEITKPHLDGIDEGSQPLPGLDFAPSLEDLSVEKIKMEEDEVRPVAEDVKQEEDEVAKAQDTENEEWKMEQDLNDTVRAAEQSVVVEELGEFGVESSLPTASEETLEQDDTTTQDSVCNEGVQVDGDKQEQIEQNDEMKTMSPQTQSDLPAGQSTGSNLKVLKGSGGFVLKVKEKTITNGADAKAAAEQRESGAAANDEDETGQEQGEEDREWFPPPPDPAFKNLPIVRRGVEESGLCSIM